MSKTPKILLVGDIVDDTNFTPDRTIFDEDNPSKSEVANLASWINEAGYEVDICDNVSNFLESGFSDENVLVFPLWRGGASRNRTAIVPAYCEALNIPYIGGDTYAQAVCQDKSLSKFLAKAIGLTVPGEIVLRTIDELSSFKPSSQLRGPLVVKPLYSACSIGIDDSSLCHDDDLARDRARYLFDAGLGPVVCEEFIEGEEISICFIEERGKIVNRCVGAFLGLDGKSPFYNRLFTFEDKMNMVPPWNISVLPDMLVESIWVCAEELIRKLGKVDIMRIDGRVNASGFFFIEFTPDIHLAIESVFLGAFNAKGWPPADLLNSVIRASILNQRP